MPKITFIGAGSLVFTRNLCNDILLTPALQDSEIVLTDINPRRLEMASTLITALAEKRGGKARISTCLDRSPSPGRCGLRHQHISAGRVGSLQIRH